MLRMNPPEHGREDAISPPRRPWINKTSKLSVRPRLEIWVSFQMDNPGSSCCKPHRFVEEQSSPNISKKQSGRENMKDHMPQLQIMICLFDAHLIPKAAISIQMPSNLNSLGFIPPPCENLPLHLFQGRSRSFQSWWKFAAFQPGEPHLVNLTRS